MEKQQYRILGIPGSLRANSSATAVLRQAANLLPANAVFTLYEGTGQLPHFDDTEIVPEPVLQFRQLLAESDGVIICTPEYAFGVPGTLKNALDWTVGTGEFVNKPVALITASSVGKNAHAALLLTLSAISANIPGSSALLIPFIRARLDDQGIINDVALLQSLQQLIDSFIEVISAPE